MYRKIILIVIAILLIALGVWIYRSPNQESPTAGGTQKGIFSSLFPFGSSSATPQAVDTTPAPGTLPATGDTGSTATAQITLAKISARKIAGFIALAPITAAAGAVHSINDDEGTGATKAPAQLPTVRYAEKGTGYIYDVDAKGSSETKVSGTIIAKTALAQFADNGATAIMRLIKDDGATVATFLGKITLGQGGQTGDLKGTFLPDNIIDVAVSPDGKSLAYVAPLAEGAVGMTMRTDGISKKQAFVSSFNEWLIDWSTTGITATTKAAAGISGYAYTISANGIFQKILGGTSGLTTKTSPDGKLVLYGIGEGSGMRLYLHQLKDGKDINLGLTTLPEKCAWNSASTQIYCGAPAGFPDGAYPDSWYQGVNHFSDSIWKIDASTATTTQVSNGGGNYLDATYLSLDSTGKYLFFINKNDGSLWSLDLYPSSAPAATNTPVLPTVQ